MHPLSDINSVTSKARAISYMLLQITSTFWYMKLHPKVMSASNNSNLNHRKFFIQLSAPAVDAPFLFLRASLSQLHLSMNSSSNVSTAGSETNSKKFSSCHWMRRRHMILTFGLLLIWVLKKCLFFCCVCIVEELYAISSACFLTLMACMGLAVSCLQWMNSEIVWNWGKCSIYGCLCKLKINWRN